MLRGAVPTDQVNILRLLKDGWQEGAAGALGPFDELRVSRFIIATLENKLAFTIVAERSGRILGSFAMAPALLPATEAKVMVEAWLAVRPEQREKGLTQRLLTAAEYVLDKSQLPMIFGTNMMASAAFDRVLSGRQGYAPVRQTFYRAPARKVAAA